MFDFQKEVILNSLEGTHGVEAFDNSIRIDGMLYKAEYMQPVYKTEPWEGKKATLTVDPAALAGKGHVQIVIELGLDKDYRGDWGSVLFYFRKPVVIDLECGDNFAAADLVKAFNTAIPAGYKFLSVVDKEAVKLEAEDSYITIRKAQLMSYECEASCDAQMEMPVLEAEATYKNPEVAPFKIEKNMVEFGTYDYLVRNLRLPTYMNLRWSSPTHAEAPQAGAKYVQYSFEYVVPRRLGGLSVAGQKNMSGTFHTFFVNEAIAEQFEGMLPVEVKDVVVADSAAEHEHESTILPESVTVKDVENEGDSQE